MVNPPFQMNENFTGRRFPHLSGAGLLAVSDFVGKTTFRCHRIAVDHHVVLLVCLVRGLYHCLAFPAYPCYNAGKAISGQDFAFIVPEAPLEQGVSV